MQTSIAKKGFTLIELLIVIAIIGLLATLAIVSLTTAQRKARDTKRVADVKQLQNAVELYYSEHAAYPLTDDTTNLSSTPSATVATWTDFGTIIGGYITNVPLDPTNTDGSTAITNTVYTYGANNTGSEYFIGARLEDVGHDALDGDDDTAYTASGSWSNMDAVESNDTSANEVVASFDCGSDSTNGIYCASE